MESDNSRHEARREFLKRAGKFALYTPPTVMMLMKPGFAQINGSLVGKPPSVATNPAGSPPPAGDPRNR
jgi:hypothetical protein